MPLIQLPVLPIVEVLPELRAALRARSAVVLEAPPGAGKSTVVPLALLEEPWLEGRRILMLQPRRIAARAVAGRMASLAGEAVGGLVGYRTRLDTRVGPSTRIEVVTEGILTRLLQSDAALDGVGAVLFDEFHERNLQSDLALALALDAQRHVREDLRLLVMSATLDGESVSRLLRDAPVVRAAGRPFEVATHYAPGAPQPAGRHPEPLERRAAAVALRALDAHPGDVLVFLPGVAEIRRAVETIRGALNDQSVRVLPLYGDLSAGEQDAALQPSPPGSRKIVVATNLAETSLTIDGVRGVVDAGLERRQRFDPNTGMSRLETLRISRASADQRRGRAGRTAPGVCYRLWSESVQQSLAPQAPAEIVEADLAPLALELACWGTTDAAALAWLDPPPAATLAQARELLVRLEAVDAHGLATETGRRMSRLSVHPRLAHMILRGALLGLGPLACEIAAVLSERDPLRGDAGSRDPDLRHRIDVLRGGAAPPGLAVDAAALQRVRRSAQLIERQARRATGPAGSVPPLAADAATGLLLAFAYPDRIGRARSGDSGRYVFSGGRGAALPGPSALARSEFIVAADLGLLDRDARIHLAAPIDRRLLEEHLGHLAVTEDEVAWDQRTESVLARRVRRLDSLVLAEEPLHHLPAGRVVPVVLEGIRSLGLACLPWTRDLEQWRERVALVRAHAGAAGESAWPDVADAALLANLEQWLAPWLEGVTRREHLSRVDLRGALHALLDWNRQRELDQLAPTHLAVPSGSRVAIDYAGGVPTLSVRLQEVFGLTETPRVAGGRVPVTMELLSPARRPVQVTRDLASFWSRGYADVRKELKGRYPKHYWPDDPYAAVPTRKVRPPGER